MRIIFAMIVILAAATLLAYAAFAGNGGLTLLALLTLIFGIGLLFISPSSAQVRRLSEDQEPDISVDDIFSDDVDWFDGNHHD